MSFARQLIIWQKKSGRHHLPWQSTRDPYKRWISEVMLQQTTVGAVLRYYPSFLQAFPDVHALACAERDAVMSVWSGLGYYTRAIHLHCSAKLIVGAGKFPQNKDEWLHLPGVGASTAAALSVFCYGQRAAILDGNVKRILARVFCIPDDIKKTATINKLWDQSHALLPHNDIESYTQGLMDLGAMICSVKKPRCTVCPVRCHCQAWQTNTMEQYPHSAKIVRKKESLHLGLCQKKKKILFVRRPERGIWPNLWCLPEITPTNKKKPITMIRHQLTHLELSIFIWSCTHAAPTEQTAWMSLESAQKIGLPQPIAGYIAAKVSS